MKLRRMTDNQCRALAAIELHRGLRRSELTPAEKRTATALVKLGYIERDHGFYVVTPVGRSILAGRA